MRGSGLLARTLAHLHAPCGSQCRLPPAAARRCLAAPRPAPPFPTPQGGAVRHAAPHRPRCVWGVGGGGLARGVGWWAWEWGWRPSGAKRGCVPGEWCFGTVQREHDTLCLSPACVLCGRHGMGFCMGRAGIRRRRPPCSRCAVQCHVSISSPGCPCTPPAPQQSGCYLPHHQPAN